MRARWTGAIHDEWVRNVLTDNPALSPDCPARTRGLMNEAVRDCLVTGYKDLIEPLSLPDLDYGVETLHPDEFLQSLFGSAPGPVCAAVKRQRESLRNPPKTAEELPATLEVNGLIQAVSRLRPFAELLLRGWPSPS